MLRVDGLAAASLAEAIALRDPELETRFADDPELVTPSDGTYAYVLVHPRSEVHDAWDITVILSDGRAFFRYVQAEPDATDRVVSTTLVNLLAAASAGSVAADARREMPRLSRDDPPDDPSDDPPDDPPDDPAVETPTPSPEIGVGVRGVVAAGFGPPRDVDALIGGGGGLTVGLRLPVGAMFAAEARAVSRRSAALQLTRVRVALAGGYAWRRAGFELIALGFVHAEPWFVTDRGKRRDVTTADPNAVFSSVLIGGGLAIAPGFRIPVGTRSSARIGLRLEAGGSSMTRGGVGRVTVEGDGGLEPAFRLGGFELAAGVDLSWWFSTSPVKRQ